MTRGVELDALIHDVDYFLPRKPPRGSPRWATPGTSMPYFTTSTHGSKDGFLSSVGLNVKFLLKKEPNCKKLGHVRTLFSQKKCKSRFLKNKKIFKFDQVYIRCYI